MINKLEYKLTRYRLISIHQDLVRSGKYDEAQLILHLLREGQIRLGLDEKSNFVEIICEAQGCQISYSKKFNAATVYLFRY